MHPSKSLYKSMISGDLWDDILSFYRGLRGDLVAVSGSGTFPERKHLRELPDELLFRLHNELRVVLQDYYFIHLDNVRIFESNYGVVKPHVDVSMNGSTHTCIIYLTDDYEGGTLSIKFPKESSGVDRPS